MTAVEFDRLVEEACARIPRRFRRMLRNVAIVVEPEPSYDQIARVGHGGTLLGLYEGRPLTSRSVLDNFTVPDRITIFQGPHERMARSREHLHTLVEHTVWHEVGHYFGMSEQQVRAMEMRLRARGRSRSKRDQPAERLE